VSFFLGQCVDLFWRLIEFEYLYGEVGESFIATADVLLRERLAERATEIGKLGDALATGYRLFFGLGRVLLAAPFLVPVQRPALRLAAVALALAGVHNLGTFIAGVVGLKTGAAWAATYLVLWPTSLAGAAFLVLKITKR
jgi:hypothetical protein